jgi:hypothetical protein
VKRLPISLKAAALGAAVLGALVAGPATAALADAGDPPNDGTSYAADFVEQETDTPTQLGNVAEYNSADHTTGMSPMVLPGGSWPDYYATGYGDRVEWGGTFRGIVEDLNRGTRLEALVHLREPGGNPDAERGVYGRADWYASHEHCYLNSLSSTTCSTGWTKVAGDDETGRVNADTTWQYWYQWDNIKATYQSGRGQFRGCIDVKWHTDVCTASILRGEEY